MPCSLYSYQRRRRAPVFLLILAFFTTGSFLQADDTSPSSADASTVVPATDVLVFPDGDRTVGKLIGRDGDVIVFQSRRFGELRVKAGSVKIESVPKTETAANPAEAPKTEIVVQPPKKPPATPAGSLAASAAAAAQATVKPPQHNRPFWESPAALAVSLLRFFGPWQGRFAVAWSLSTDTSKRQDLGVDLKFGRKWKNDQASFETHYDVSRTNHITDTDLFKGSGLYRHDFKGPFFVNYRPSLEWNRDYIVNGKPADYVLLQQALGVGINVLDRKNRKIGVGIAENITDLWTIPDHTHSTHDSQSFFTEFDFSLPWRITLTNRDVWYYTLSTGDRGWEDQFELTKKFSDTLSLGLRQETRRHNPDTRIADYSLWRLQLGLDF